MRHFVRAAGHIVAALGFGTSAWKVKPLDQAIRWTRDQRQRSLHLVVNNAQFLILPWIHCKNPASRILALVSRRLDIDWATRAHAAVSSFLHQPTITRVAKSGGVDHRTLQRKTNEVISRLDSILASKISHARLEFRFGYAWPACGEDIRVAILPMMIGTAKTSCRACKAEWNVESSEGSDTPRFVRRTVSS